LVVAVQRRVHLGGQRRRDHDHDGRSFRRRFGNSQLHVERGIGLLVADGKLRRWQRQPVPVARLLGPDRYRVAAIELAGGLHLYHLARPGDHAEAICLPFITKPKPAEWLDLLRQGYLDIQARKPDLIVFDTLSHLWSVEKENDNGEMQSAIMPLRGISELGPAVLAIHHAGQLERAHEEAPR
jgi:hypothetical protein